LSNSSAIEAMCGAIDVILDAHSENTRTCTPVVVQSWTEPSTAGARCDVQLTIPNRAPDGSAIEPTPVVAERPVYYPAGGGWTIHYPLEAGDEVLGLCIDRNTEGWTTNRTPGAPSHALFERFHSESDMVVLAAADRPELPDATPDLDTDFVITHRTGGVVVRLGTDGKVTLTASASASIVVQPDGTITLTGTTVELGGESATLGNARLNDTTSSDTTMTIWMAGVQTVCTAAGALLGTPAPVFPSDFGKITSASTIVKSL
jgi:hypothetical protein